MDSSNLPTRSARDDDDLDWSIDCDSECEGEAELPGRPYCTQCGKLKGSKRGRFYPEKPCRSCGSVKTYLENAAGKTIDWSKWLKLQHDKPYEEYQCFLASEYGFPPEDY